MEVMKVQKIILQVKILLDSPVTASRIQCQLVKKMAELIYFRLSKVLTFHLRVKRCPSKNTKGGSWTFETNHHTSKQNQSHLIQLQIQMVNCFNPKFDVKLQHFAWDVIQINNCTTTTVTLEVKWATFHLHPLQPINVARIRVIRVNEYLQFPTKVTSIRVKVIYSIQMI